MKTETSTTRPSEDVLADVWKLKEENAAEYDYDIDAIAAAARKHQESHPHLIVRRSTTGAEQTAAANGHTTVAEP